MGTIFEMLKSLFDEEDQRIQDQIDTEAPSCPINPQPHHPHVVVEKTLEDFDGDCAAAIKMVLSGLTENSSGNGCYKRTVIHAVAIKPICKKSNSGWLRRKPREFLCATIRRHKGFGISERVGEDITCQRCKGLVERYKLNLCSDPELGKIVNSY